MNPPAASPPLDSRTNDGSPAPSPRLRSGSSSRRRHAPQNSGWPDVSRRAARAPEHARHREMKAWTKCAWTRRGTRGRWKSGQIGGHTGKEVRVPRAGRRGGFAPVSPGGFIEPHTAWYGVPATVLYAMYQNAADPRPSRYRRRRNYRRRRRRRRRLATADDVARSQTVTPLYRDILHFKPPFARALEVRRTSFRTTFVSSELNLYPSA